MHDKGLVYCGLPHDCYSFSESKVEQGLIWSQILCFVVVRIERSESVFESADMEKLSLPEFEGHKFVQELEARHVKTCP